MRALGIDPSRPSVVFVGRITRQKGLPYFLRAVELLPPDVQVVLCAGAPDTPQIMAEVTGLVEQLRTKRSGVVWIEQMLPRDELIAVLMHGTVFACPSVYEPLGIVNLEAMAVGLPGRRDRHRRHPRGHRRRRHRPARADRPAAGRHRHPGRPRAVRRTTWPTRSPTSSANTARTAQWGLASRRRVEDHFTWEAIAERTIEVYRAALA